jgi:hypothetical protein
VLAPHAGRPTFLVGRILADDDPAMYDGRASMAGRIQARRN